jgi:hypothetical protein
VTRGRSAAPGDFPLRGTWQPAVVLAPRLLLVPALKLAERRARGRFADRFARLTDKRSRRRVSALTGAAAA